MSCSAKRDPNGTWHASHKAGKSLAEPSESDLCFDACVKTNKDHF